MSDSEQADQYRQFIEQLHEPWSHRAARRKLVAARAVKPLLQCLQDNNESVVWAAIQSLGELRAGEAVGPLIDLLERGELTLDVIESLKLITGQDFAADVKGWRQWAAGSTGGGPPPLDVAECVRRTAGYLGIEPAGSGNSYKFKLPLADERTQKVAVYFGRQDAGGEELVVIYSECGPANPKFYEAVLRKNLGIPAGAFAVRDVGKVPHFVIVDTLIAATVTPSLLAKKIENIASRADVVEKSLTKEDRR